jgi:hypothetical protein
MTHEPTTRHLSTDELTSFLEQLAHELPGRQLPGKPAAATCPPYDPDAPTRLYRRTPTAPRLAVDSTAEPSRPAAVVRLARPLAVGFAPRRDESQQPKTVLELERPMLAMPTDVPRGAPLRRPMSVRRLLIALTLGLLALTVMIAATSAGNSPTPPARAQEQPASAAVHGADDQPSSHASERTLAGATLDEALATTTNAPLEAGSAGARLEAESAGAPLGAGSAGAPLGAGSAGHPLGAGSAGALPRALAPEGGAPFRPPVRDPAAPRIPPVPQEVVQPRSGERPAALTELTARERRAAVDLLVAGDTRAALEAYRARLRAEPTALAFAELVRLLERELQACALEREDTCVRQ